MKLKTCEKIKYGELTKGCAQCVAGRKSVLFITGKCHYQCFYCPISDDKRGKDIVKINELIVENPDDLSGLKKVIKEIKDCSSLGVGITGGDPLLSMNRTVFYITQLKKEFGKNFHIHLYTSLQCVTQDRLFELEKAGLDELRFHVPIEDITQWEKMEFAKGLNMLIGVEIPAIPGMLEKTKELIYYCKQLGVIKFINLNELEFSDISEETLTNKGYYVKNELSYGIKDSEVVAIAAVNFGKEINMPIHYCSAGFKDEIQLGNRLLLRSENVRKSFDEVDEQGMLLRGEIRFTSEGLSQSYDGEYSLEEIKSALEEYYEIPSEMIEVENDRILLSAYILEEIWRDLQENKDNFLFGDYIEASIIKEYPTSDHFLLEKNYL